MYSVFFRPGRPDDELYRRHRVLQTHFPRSLTYVVEDGRKAGGGKVVAVLHGPHKFTGEEDESVESSLFTARGYEGQKPDKVHVTEKMNGKFAMMGYVVHGGQGFFIVGAKKTKVLVHEEDWTCGNIKCSGLVHQIVTALRKFWFRIPAEGRTKLQRLMAGGWKDPEEKASMSVHTLVFELNDGKHMIPLDRDETYVTLVAVVRCVQDDVSRGGPVLHLEGKFVYEWLAEVAHVPTDYIVRYREMSYQAYQAMKETLHVVNLFDDDGSYGEGYVVYQWAADGHWLAMEKRKNWSYVILRVIREWILGRRSEPLRVRLATRNRSYMRLNDLTLERWVRLGELFCNYVDHVVMTKSGDGDVSSAVGFGDGQYGMGNTWRDFEKHTSVRHGICYGSGVDDDDANFEAMVSAARAVMPGGGKGVALAKSVYIVDLNAGEDELEELGRWLREEKELETSVVVRLPRKLGNRDDGRRGGKVYLCSRPPPGKTTTMTKEERCVVFLDRGGGKEGVYERRLPNVKMRMGLLTSVRKACEYTTELDGLVDVVKRLGGEFARWSSFQDKFLVVGFHTVIGVGKSSVLRAVADRMGWGYVQKDEVQREMYNCGEINPDSSPALGATAALLWRKTRDRVRELWEGGKRTVVLDRNFGAEGEFRTVRELVKEWNMEAIVVDFGLRPSSKVDMEEEEEEEEDNGRGAGWGLGTIAERLVCWKRRAEELPSHFSIRSEEALVQAGGYFFTDKFQPRSASSVATVLPAAAMVNLWKVPPRVVRGRDKVGRWMGALRNGDGEACFALADEIEVEYVATPLEDIVESLVEQLAPLKEQNLDAETEEEHLPGWVLRDRVMSRLTFCHLQNEYTVVDSDSVEALQALLPNTVPTRPTVFPPEEFDLSAEHQARKLHQKALHVTIIHRQYPSPEVQRRFNALPDQVRFRAVQTCAVDGLACIIVKAVDESIDKVLKALKLDFGPLHVTMLCDRALGHTPVKSNFLLQYDDVEVRDVQTVVEFLAERSSFTSSSLSLR